MRADDSVFCLGEDIGAFGGAFKVTDGFIDEFGAQRVMDTPLAESGIIGTAVGASGGVFCEGEAEPLGDGQAPWSRFAEVSDA